MSEEIKTHRVGIIMNGVTGRIGSNQHLNHSILPIIRDGGIKLSRNEVILPDPILVGRNETKLKKLSEESGISKWTTDLDSVMNDEDYPVYFDALRSDLRVPGLKRALAAGKHIYSEKPTSERTEEALDLYHMAEEAGVKHGVVQDKIWLPGLMKLKKLIDQDFFGQILSVKGEFGYWVFEGDYIPGQRPSWNYRKEDGGGITLDMFCHWRYILDHLFGNVKGLFSICETQIDERIDEEGNRYKATADDAVYTTFELENGALAHFNTSWTTRVRRDDLLTIQIDGKKGSAVAGLRDVWIQPYEATPKPVWNPDVENSHNYLDDWMKVPNQQDFENAFRIQWELFLKHVVADTPYKWNFLEAAKGTQLADLGYESSEKRTWVEVPELK